MQVKELTKQYDGKTVVDGVSFAIPKGKVLRYKAQMDRSRTRYQIAEETEQEDGSVLVRVRKQYNDRVDVSEYFR